MHAIRCSLLSLVAATALCAPATSAILRVKLDAPGPTHDGTTWTTAYLKVGDALTASLSRDEVWVAAGTYMEAVTLNAGRSLLGGFAGTETTADQRDPSANVTVLDANGNKAPVVSVMTSGTDTALLDGFTIQGGYGYVTSVCGGCTGVPCHNGTCNYYHTGGGVYIAGGTPTVSNNRIINNDTSFSQTTYESTWLYITNPGDGGGIYVVQGYAAINHNVISGNHASSGGGIAVAGGGPTISYNTITGNNGEGGGICVGVGGGNVLVTGNTVSGNIHCVAGGGIAVFGGTTTVTDNLITMNSADYAGGIVDGDGGLILSHNTITFNIGTNGGGGLLHEGGDAIVSDNIISGNSTYENGGGVISEESGTLSLLRNVITSNNAGEFGGGMWCAANATLTDNLIANNTANILGGGVFVFRGSSVASLSPVSMLNNTIAGNTAVDGGGGIGIGNWGTPDVGAVLTNNIVALNGSGVLAGRIDGASQTGPLPPSEITPTFSHNCVFGNTAYDFQGITSPIGTNGNVAYDPSFKDPDNGNYRLSPGSSCIDAGDNSAVTTGDTDLDGNPRVIGAHVDIGCYETASSTGRASALRALKIAAGLAAIQPGDLISLDVVAGNSASKVDMRDAVALLRAANGLG